MRLQSMMGPRNAIFVIESRQAETLTLRDVLAVHTTTHPLLLSVLNRTLVTRQYALLSEFVRARSTLQSLLEVISPHVEVQLLLVSLEGRRRRRVR